MLSGVPFPSRKYLPDPKIEIVSPHWSKPFLLKPPKKHSKIDEIFLNFHIFISILCERIYKEKIVSHPTLKTILYLINICYEINRQIAYKDSFKYCPYNYMSRYCAYFEDKEINFFLISKNYRPIWFVIRASSLKAMKCNCSIHFVQFNSFRNVMEMSFW